MTAEGSSTSYACWPRSRRARATSGVQERSSVEPRPRTSAYPSGATSTSGERRRASTTTPEPSSRTAVGKGGSSRSTTRSRWRSTLLDEVDRLEARRDDAKLGEDVQPGLSQRGTETRPERRPLHLRQHLRVDGDVFPEDLSA